MLANLSVARKILLIPLIGSIGFVVYLTLSTLTANQNVSYLSDAKEVQFPFVLLVTEVAHKIDNVETALNSAVTTGDQEQVEKAEGYSEEIVEALQRLQSVSPSAVNKIVQIESLFVRYFESGKTLSNGMINGTIDFDKLGEMGKALNQILAELRNQVLALKSSHIDALRGSIEHASGAGEDLVKIGYAMGAITIALLLLSSIPISKSIQNSLVEVVTSLKRMAEGEGDLTVRLNTKSLDEIGELVQWFNAFVAKLQVTISELLTASEPLMDMADKVNSSACEAKSVTESQQTGIDQTRIAVQEMNASVSNIAENASKTADSVEAASQISESGAQVVGRTVESIGMLANNVSTATDVVNRLEHDVDQVGNVLSVIQNIAEQTNLLALNAAIEAARAGEQGRGFAVVADEVRTLASRTQDSTTEIQTTIEKLQVAAREAVETMAVGKDMAQQSVEQAAEAGSSLENIENTVSNINHMAMTIAKATDEQSQVAVNIAGSIDDISGSTQRTSHSATQLANVSSDLKELASTLFRLTSGFTV